MKKVLKEPLIHFLLIGVFLFLLYGFLNPSQDENEIVIDDNLINELVAKWELKRNRRPTLEEVSGMVNQYIEQEVMYNEALAMNLDHNDEIVKRRLAQKLEFISDGLAESLQPTTEILKKYYDEHKNQYEKAPIYTLQQVYFSKEKRNDAFADATAALSSENPESLGDNLSITSEYAEASAFIIGRDYGTSFANHLDSLETGKWTGPISSGYGVHIIFIKEKKVAGYYSYEEVSDKVLTDYNFEASNDFKTELIASLLKDYDITIDLEDKVLKKELDEKY